MQEQMNNVSEEMEILRKNQTEILEMKNTVLEMKIAFDKLISRQETTQERTSALKNMTIENSKSEKQGKKDTHIQNPNRTAYPRTTKFVTCVMGIPKGEVKERKERKQSLKS